MIEPNVPLFQKVLDHLTAHPDEHNQGVWGIAQRITNGTPCGTAYCLAGTVVAFSNQCQLVWRDWLRQAADLVAVVPGATGNVVLDPGDALPDGSIEVLRAANELLGITGETSEMHPIYAGHHSLETLWSIANHICGGQLTVPAEIAASPAYLFRGKL